MKFLFRFIISIAAVVIDFHIVSWANEKVIQWTIEWHLLWFILGWVVEYFVLVNILHLSTLIIAWAIVESITKHQFMAIKWGSLGIAWILCIINGAAIYHFVDFSITKGWVAGIVAIGINAAIPLVIIRRLKPIQEIFEDGLRRMNNEGGIQQVR